MTLGLAVSAISQGKEMSLWPNEAPGALGQAPHDIPTLTPFLAPADNNSGSAIVICPGGGYGGLASHEGATYAQFLQKHGINAFVLKYRLGSAGYRHPIMLGDAALASRFADAMLEKGVYVIGFSYPVVPQGKARIRTQMSAGLTRDDLDAVLRCFEKVGPRVGVI